MELHKRIRSRREELGLSQEELAKMVGYTDRSSIAKIESGKNDLTQTKILAFAKALQTTPGYLMGWDTPSHFPADDNMSIADNIKHLRESHGMSQAEFGRIAGVTDKAVSTWENGLKAPRMGAVQRLSDYFGIRKSDILDDDPAQLPTGATPYNPTHKIPLLGRIAAGLPLYAEENLEGFIWTERNHGGEYFALRVSGDSMNAAGIKDGDVIVIRQQPEVEDGAIAVVLVDDEATVKRYHQQGGSVILSPQSTNPAHLPQIYSLKEHNVKVLGLVLEARTEIQN